MRRSLKIFFEKTGKIVFILAAVSWALGAFAHGVCAATYYMPDDYANLQAAFSAMSGGDTLIVRDGTYTGSSNIINSTQVPPAGTSANWTVIKAEHPGSVFFGDADVNTAYFNISNTGNLYTEFRGLIWLGGGVMNYGTEYVKFIQCGNGNNLVNTGNSAEFSIFYTSNVLCEDCFAWGGRRYSFIAYRSSHIIFRRCVGRHDAINTTHDGSKTEPIGGISIYWSSNCEVQNCIIIDSDTGDYWTYESLAGAFAEPNGDTGENNYFRGCVALNLDLPPHEQRSTYINSHRINMVAWDTTTGTLLRGQTYISHFTAGGIKSPLGQYATVDSYEGTTNVTDSVFVNISAGQSVLTDVESSNYNYFYNNSVANYRNTEAGSHDVYNVNPLTNSLRYLLRIEANSDLSGKASDGGDIGATVMKRIGVSGTLWGEPGYNITTDEDLWPWHNEDIIESNMRTYSHPQINGARGFCADGKQLNGIDDITLTSYIWEYLGNPIPPEIYGGGGSNQKPIANAGPDQNLIDIDDNGLEQVALDASASYDPDGSIISYVWSENGSQIATGVNPTISLDIGTHLLSLAVTDDESATSTDEVLITINPAEGDQTPPVISNVQSLNVASRSATISWDTDEASTSKVLYGLTSSYGQEVENVALVTNHEVALSGLEPSTTYHFQVISRDGNNNEASSCDYTFITQEDGAGINVQVNFQPAGRPIPDGFDADYGYVWDNDRGYGWDQDVSGKARDKNVNPDQRLDTYIYADDSVRTWEVALPNGEYQISLSVGEPEYVRGNHKVLLEGEQVIYGSTQPNEYITIENYIVNVTDGRLTVQIGGGEPVGGQDPWGLTDLNYIIIESQGSNEKPHASAGSDQDLTDSDYNGSEQVVLDASASYDPDGSIISYVWSENGSQIATGVNPTISLDIGTHVLSLAVTDNESAISTDEVRITINPAEGDQTSPVISNVQSVNIASRSATISWDTDEPSTSKVQYGLISSYGQQVENVAFVTNHEVILSGLEPSSTYHFQVISKDGNNNEASSSDYTFTTQSEGTTFNALQDFEDGVVWIPGGGQDPTGNGRGWAFLDAGLNAKIEIDTIGANGSNHSLKVTFDSDNPQIYLRSNDKTTDHMPEAQGANRMSFYVRFPEGFPIQPLPFRYDTWQLGTYIHDPNDWYDTHSATSELDYGIHHYYHRVTIEQVGNGWVKYIVTTQPDQATYSGSTVPPDIPYYYDNFGRFYFHFGPEAGGPAPPRPFTIWIDEIKFYHDDRTIGGQVHDGGQDDAGFDGEFIPDSAGTPDVSTSVNFQPAGRPIPDGFDADYGYVWDNDRGYGWDQDVSGKARDKDVNSDQSLDTYIYADDSVRTWEIAFPNGQYKVSLACGEPEYSRGNHRVILEGEEVVNGSTQPDEFIRVENHPVTLADGRLTVQIGGGVAVADPWGLTSLNYIIIESVSGSALPPPDSLSAQSTNSIELSWSSVTGAVGYNVYRSITQGIGYVKINSYPVTGTSYLDENTTPGVTYYYVVTSLNSDGGESSYSPEASCTEPLAPPVNQAPQITGFTAIPSSLNNPGETTTFNVSATDPDGDSLTYTISFGDGTANGSGSEVVHTYEAGAGEPPHIYTATVTVSDGHGHSVGQSLQVTVNDIPPVEPKNVSAN